MRVLKLTTKDADTWSKVGEHEIYVSDNARHRKGFHRSDSVPSASTAWLTVSPTGTERQAAPPTNPTQPRSISMSRVSFDISMSLDGFIAAANQRPDEPLGEGGQRLHDWAFASDDDRNRAVLTGGVEGAGAMIAGRRTYDDSLP
jgi:hypothetical protein